MKDTGVTKSSYSHHSVAATFTWLIWVIMVLVAIYHAVQFGRNLPLEEDWQMVPPLTGHESNYLRFLWEQNNEHRIPLPKFIYLVLLKITHGDFRAGMYFNILILAGLSALFILAAKKVRGTTSYSDAFFPIVLLHLGHWANLFWSWQIAFVLPTVLTCLQLIIIIQYRQLLSYRKAVILAFITVLLPLCGANGLLYLLPVWPCLAYEGYLHLRNKEAGANRNIGIMLFGAIVLSFLVAIAYFIGYEKPYWIPPNPGVLPTIKTFFKFLAMGLGPISSSAWGLFAAIVSVYLIITAWLLLAATTRLKGVALRQAIGMCLFFGGYMLFAIAMGYGRAGWVPTMGMPIRYVLLAVPLLIISYYTWQLYGSGFTQKGLQWSLFMLMVLFIYKNTREGYIWKDWYVENADKVIGDIKAGVPRSELYNRHQPYLLHSTPQYLARWMEYLKDAEMGPFTDMKVDSKDNIKAK